MPHHFACIFQILIFDIKVSINCRLDELKAELVARGSVKQIWVMPQGMDLSGYCFRETVEGDDILEEDVSLCALPSCQAALEAKPPRFPLLLLVDKVNQNKLDFESALSSLLEHSISSCKEVRDFRKHMVDIRQKGTFKIDTVEYPVNVVKNPYLSPTPASITVKVFYTGQVSTNKLARLQPTMPSVNAIEEVVKKMQMAMEERMRDRPVSSWILKVVGRHEFIFGDAALIDHRYIRDCLAYNKEVCLKLVHRVDEAKKLSKSKRHSVVMNSSALSSDFVDSFANVPEQNSASYESNSRDVTGAVARTTSESSSDTIYRFNLAKVSVPNSLLREFDKATGEQRSADNLGTVFCEFGVVFGVDYIWNGLKPTPDFRLTASEDGLSLVAETNDHEVSFELLPVSRIPYGSRITCNIYHRYKGKDSLLGGLTYNVFSHDRVFDCSQELHTFWSIKRSKANPLSVVIAENKVIRGACSISLRFSSFSKPFFKEPTVPLNYDASQHIQEPSADVLQSLNKILSYDALTFMSSDDKQLLWQNRHWAKSRPHALCKVLRCVNWTDPQQEVEILSMMKTWAPLSRQDALGLLDACYAHPDVRSFAVSALSSIDDDYLLGIMLQLTQALKYEPYHLNALALFLLKRALRNRLIGHRFFWYLKAEIHQIEIRERYGLILEAYLHACGDFRREIFRENKVLNDLTTVGNIIKSTPTAERLQKLRQELSLIQFPVHPDGFLIPTDFGVRVKGLVIDKCKYMDSKKLPLWLVFANADPDGPNVYVIFKVGDDLRQDILTLQMITLMYKQVQNSSLGLDLRMRPYAVVATGSPCSTRVVIFQTLADSYLR